MLMLFSDFVESPETRSDIGTAYIVVIILFACVHLFFLFAVTIKSLVQKCKEKCEKRKLEKLKEQRVAEKAKAKKQSQLSAISEESEGLESIESERNDRNRRRPPLMRMQEFHANVES
mmetsp:Transcript_33284/g.39144  ORF Transcript_33284/g.39144 Transcript_33284/m.39144 type:complete len:118 (+) Transcript_33284:464-817(+)